MLKTTDGKKVWDTENFKWVIIKADGSKKDLYKEAKKVTKKKTKKKSKTKSKKKKK